MMPDHETRIRELEKANVAYVDANTALIRENERLREALEPFAKAGKVINSPFGPALFAEDNMAFRSGCAWTENGEIKTITWGDFRAARAAIDKGKNK